MIVCSCNVLSDTEVRTVANTATRRPTSYVYSCLGCRARCGRCARTIREIMDEVFDGAKVGRTDGGAVLAAPADKQPSASMVAPSSGIARWCCWEVQSKFSRV